LSVNDDATCVVQTSSKSAAVLISSSIHQTAMLCAPGHLQIFVTALLQKAREQTVPTASKVMYF